MSKQEISMHISSVERKAPGSEMLAYRNHIAKLIERKSGAYEHPEEVLRIPHDPAIFADAERMIARLWTNQLKYIVLVGIGGSNLGTKAVYDALAAPLGRDTFPKIIFLDTVSEAILSDARRVLERDVRYKEEIVINLVSKSGTTTESLYNFSWIYSALLPHIEDLSSRVFVTTDHDSALWKAAEKEGIATLPIPRNVGGRFSVFSHVGLVPLALSGVDIAEFVRGGRAALEDVGGEHDTAFTAAFALREAMRGGASILDLWYFDPSLESAGKWCRQLYAESLGKELDRSGRTVRTGFTPTVSIGSTDLHSVAQLNFGGPKDKVTVLTRFSEKGNRPPKNVAPFSLLGGTLLSHAPKDVLGAIYAGVREAYRKHELPLLELELPPVSSYALGLHMEWHMLVVIYLARLMNVNAFDQPNVEDYKTVTREILSRGR